MDPELEGLLRAYDAAREASEPEAARLAAVFESRMDDTLAAHPGLSRETLFNMVRLAHRRWLRAQEKPSTLPPKA
jgi:hypothetical protein